ncbi:MAG: class I SAM-dependent methyltransferase, partial [Clostridia bacterium]
WRKVKDFDSVARIDAHYLRSDSGGGLWEYSDAKKMPEEWIVGWRNLRFCVKPMGFKHTGLFPEQAVNWETMIQLIKGAGREINVLNLFAYTGGATVACASAGANVCHVDSAKNMVDRAKYNVELSGLKNANIRYIVDDCRKFVKREISRGKKYDAIIMDPPSYGRGANNEIWKLEDDIYDFVELCSQVLSDKPLFTLINSYTTGLQPLALANILSRIFGRYGGQIDAYEVGVPTLESGIILPCGASGMYLFSNKR